MDFLPLDYVLTGVGLLLTAIGLFRGFSGEVGSLAGFAAAAAAGFLLPDAAGACAAAAGFGDGAATYVVLFVFILLAFGLARWLTAKFVSKCVPQPTNALLGALSGLVKSALILAAFTGVGFLRPGEYATGPLTAYSAIVRAAAEQADAWAGPSAEGRAR